MTKEEQLKLAQEKAAISNKGSKHGAKGKRLISDSLKRFLTQEDYKQANAIAMALIRKASDGDVHAAREVLDRTEGKVQNDTKISGDNDAPVIIQVITGIDDNDMIESLDDD